MTEIASQVEAAGLQRRGWGVDDAEALYRVGAWSDGRFGLNEAGHVTVRPSGEPAGEVDIFSIVEGLEQRGLQTPVLIRFPDMIEHRLKQIRRAFDDAMRENDYTGGYSAVYPIKVNQQQHIVEEVCRYGAPLGFGIEAGSKPELLIALATTAQRPEQLIICNGFKDARYIQMVMLATKMGRTIIPVIENIAELDLCLRFAKRYGVRPDLGVRIKLTDPGSGRWSSSGGVRSKFGLFASEVLDVVERLKQEGMEDALRLVHCHAGSQLQDIRTVKGVVTELARIYADLSSECPNLDTIDVGGGLGVDYTGAQTDSESSTDYTLEEYARNVVYHIGSVCKAETVPQPRILTECGRAMVAHSSVLVTNVLGSTGPTKLAGLPCREQYLGSGVVSQPIRDLLDVHESLSVERLAESFHDLTIAYEQVVSAFRYGFIPLRHRAFAERLYWSGRAVLLGMREGAEDELPEDILEIEAALPETYFCNFSVFQSLPDVWAIRQLFPVMPIHRLDERPDKKVVLVDITCDSDGKIDAFIGDPEQHTALDAHTLTEETYYMGVFLVGAYQESLGDLHNLFGETNAVHIGVRDGKWGIMDVVRGDTSDNVLGYMQYDTKRFRSVMALDCERALDEQRMSMQETREFLSLYEGALSAYTYLEDDHEQANGMEGG